MEAKVAIPIKKDCLSTHFRECSHYAVYTIINSKIVDKNMVMPETNQPFAFANWFKHLAITDVVTYKINHQIIDAFIKNKINVFVGASQQTPDTIIKEYLNGKLTSNEDILINDK